MQDETFLRQALALAAADGPRTSPNPRVGALLVHEGQVVGQGRHNGPGTPHAEAAALTQAGELARGATLYVTLEPCSHWGRTPPCAAALIEAGVRRVVAPIEDPNPLVDGRGFAALRDAGIKVDVGLLDEEARELNRAYLHWRRHGRPLVTAKWAQALCGHVATRTGASRYLTGPQARRQVHRLRAASDAVMVGIGTALADDPRLTVRDAPGLSPTRVVLDSRLRLPRSARMLSEGGQTWLFAAEDGGPDLPWPDGVEIVRVARARDGLLLEAVLEELGRREVTSLLVEGGPTLLGGLFDAGLCDDVAVFFAPLLLGGTGAPAGVLGRGAAQPDQGLRFRDGRWSAVGRDMLFTGKLERG